MWYGTPVGMMHSSDNSARRAKARAMASWPMWMGLNAPPKMPILLIVLRRAARASQSWGGVEPFEPSAAIEAGARLAPPDPPSPDAPGPGKQRQSPPKAAAFPAIHARNCNP